MVRLLHTVLCVLRRISQVVEQVLAAPDYGPFGIVLESVLWLAPIIISFHTLSVQLCSVGLLDPRITRFWRNRPLPIYTARNDGV